MQTHFTDADLQKPHIQEAERILRTCVHCGFCNATCPTYQLLGDERDGPRGRIYLMKELLRAATMTTRSPKRRACTLIAALPVLTVKPPALPAWSTTSCSTLAVPKLSGAFLARQVSGPSAMRCEK